MIKLANLLLLSVLLFGFAAPIAADAAVGVSLVGLGDFSTPSNSGARPFTGLSGSVGFGAGLLLDVPFKTRIAIEFGALYRTGKLSLDASNFSGGAAGAIYSGAYNEVEVPLTLMIMLSRRVFLDLGGYFASFIGGPVASASDGSSVAFAGWGDLGQNTLRYGATGGLGVNVPAGKVNLRVEALYELQLSNSFDAATTAADSTASFKYSAVELRVGLNFGGRGSGPGLR